MKNTSIPNPVKSIGYMKCCSQSGLLKARAILSDTTAIRSAVDRKELKPYWKLEKGPHFSR